jgi:hypothetical protein
MPSHAQDHCPPAPPGRRSGDPPKLGASALDPSRARPARPYPAAGRRGRAQQQDRPTPSSGQRMRMPSWPRPCGKLLWQRDTSLRISRREATFSPVRSIRAIRTDGTRTLRKRFEDHGCTRSAAHAGGLASYAGFTEHGPHPPADLGAVALRCKPSSSSLAVPPACHKERSRAVSSGQLRSLGEGS